MPAAARQQPGEQEGGGGSDHAAAATEERGGRRRRHGAARDRRRRLHAAAATPTSRYLLLLCSRLVAAARRRRSSVVDRSRSATAARRQHQHQHGRHFLHRPPTTHLSRLLLLLCTGSHHSQAQPGMRRPHPGSGSMLPYQARTPPARRSQARQLLILRWTVQAHYSLRDELTRCCCGCRSRSTPGSPCLLGAHRLLVSRDRPAHPARATVSSPPSLAPRSSILWGSRLCRPSPTSALLRRPVATAFLLRPSPLLRPACPSRRRLQLLPSKLLLQSNPAVSDSSRQAAFAAPRHCRRSECVIVRRDHKCDAPSAR